MDHHVHHRGDGGNAVLMGIHHGSHDEDIGHFTYFRGLDVEGHQGQLDPALVAAGVHAEGDQQRQQQNVKDHQRRPMLRKGIHVDGGHNGVK